MGMRIRLVAVIPVASVRKSEFQNLPQRFQQDDISIDRRQTHGGKIDFDLLINLFHIGMPLAAARIFTIANR